MSVVDASDADPDAHALVDEGVVDTTVDEADHPESAADEGADEGGVGEAVDEDEVVETDLVPGGWASWDLTGPSLRTFSAGALGAGPSRAGEPSRFMAEAAAELVYTWRSDRGLRQREAAEHLGVGQSWLSRIERGDAAVGLDLLARLASATGSDVSVRIVPGPCGRPVRRIARTARVGRAAVQLVVTGPEARTSPAGTGIGGRRGNAVGDRRPPGPIF